MADVNCEDPCITEVPVTFEAKETDETYVLCVTVNGETASIEWEKCCNEEDECIVDGGTVTYADGPGITPDNGAAFALGPITRYCVEGAPSSPLTIWHVKPDTNGNPQWHQV